MVTPANFGEILEREREKFFYAACFLDLENFHVIVCHCWMWFLVACAPDANDFLSFILRGKTKVHANLIYMKVKAGFMHQ